MDRQTDAGPYIIQGGPQNGTIFVCLITLSNINRFSNLFHCQNQEKICNNITKNSTTPQVCGYTIAYLVKCRVLLVYSKLKTRRLL